MSDKPEDTIRYWLCCGSKEVQHGERVCHEAKIGNIERVRFGTAKEHSDWQLKRLSNAH